MKNFSTIDGDTFDLVAFKTLGSCRYTELIINANRDKIEYFIFPAGIELIIPDVKTESVVKLPPWRR